jgi:hypothetical protein
MLLLFIQRLSSLRSFGAAVLACTLLTACHSSTAQRAVSPLIGTWQINGAMPEPDANMPRFTQFTFRRDGTLDASYVAAGGALASVVKSSSQVRQEHNTYTLVGKRHLRIIEGSRSLEYTYEVRDGKLFLSGPGSDTPTVYAPVHSSESDSEESDPTPASQE